MALVVQHMQPAHADELEALQRIVFPRWLKMN